MEEWRYSLGGELWLGRVGVVELAAVGERGEKGGISEAGNEGQPL